MSVQTIRELMRELQGLRIANAALEVRNAKLLVLAKKAQERQDHWKGLYYELVHNKKPEYKGDIPDIFKDFLK